MRVGCVRPLLGQHFFHFVSLHDVEAFQHLLASLAVERVDGLGGGVAIGNGRYARGHLLSLGGEAQAAVLVGGLHGVCGILLAVEGGGGGEAHDLAVLRHHVAYLFL